LQSRRFIGIGCAFSRNDLSFSVDKRIEVVAKMWGSWGIMVGENLRGGHKTGLLRIPTRKKYFLALFQNFVRH
jgi:hypothetical protein